MFVLIRDEETKTVITNFNEKKMQSLKKKIHAFLFITIALLLGVSIYCYMKN